MKKRVLKKNLFIFLSGLILTSNSLYAQPLDVTFRNFGPGDGLPVTSVTSVTQDISGIIWIGTWDGVFTYDGKQFTKKVNYGRYVEADRKGNVWIAIGGGTLLNYNTLTDSTKTYEIKTVRRYIDFVLDNKDNVWASSPEGIFRINTKTDSFEIDPGQKTGHTSAIKVKPDGDLLFYYHDNENNYYIGQRDKNGEYSYQCCTRRIKIILFQMLIFEMETAHILRHMIRPEF